MLPLLLLLSCFPYAAAFIIVLTNIILVWPIMHSGFTQKSKEVHRSPVFAHVIDRNSSTYENYLGNRGSLLTPELSATHPSRALVGDGDEVYMEHVLRGEAMVVNRYYTPNRIVYDIEGLQEGEMVISMGYDPGWRAADGRRLWQHQGLIAFTFYRGLQKVALEYRPPYFLMGLIVSIISALTLVIIWRRR